MPAKTRGKVKNQGVPLTPPDAPVELPAEGVEQKTKGEMSEIQKRNAYIKQIQGDDDIMHSLVECAIETEYWWFVCDSVEPELVGSKLASRFNDIQKFEGDAQLTWREANRCFTSYRKKFISQNRFGEWKELFDAESYDSLRKILFQYLMLESDYKELVKRGEVPWSSEASSSDNEANHTHKALPTDADDNDDEDDDEDDILIFPSPPQNAESSTTRWKTAERRPGHKSGRSSTRTMTSSRVKKPKKKPTLPANSLSNADEQRSIDMRYERLEKTVEAFSQKGRILKRLESLEKENAKLRALLSDQKPQKRLKSIESKMERFEAKNQSHEIRIRSLESKSTMQKQSSGKSHR